MIHSRKDKGGRICIISATLDKLGWKLTESVNEFRFELDNPECDFVMDENRAKCNKKMFGYSYTQKFIAASQSDYFLLQCKWLYGLFFPRASLFSCRVVIAQLQLDADVLPVRYFYFYNNCWSLPRNWGTLNYFQECTDYFCSVQVKIYQTYFLLFPCYFSLLTINHYL